jgi:hypothetical protein
MQYAAANEIGVSGAARGEVFVERLVREHPGLVESCNVCDGIKLAGTQAA